MGYTAYGSGSYSTFPTSGGSTYPVPLPTPVSYYSSYSSGTFNTLPVPPSYYTGYGSGTFDTLPVPPSYYTGSGSEGYGGSY